MDLYEKYRLSRVRHRYMRDPSRSRRGPALIAVLVLIAAMAAVTVFERNRAGRRRAIAEYAAANQVEALAAIADAMRTHRFVLLGDVVGAAAPKRFAAETITALARSSGLDIVALEVGADLQPALDRYLDSDPEDATALLNAPHAGSDAELREMLGLCRRIWNLNRELGADRRIGIIAIDEPGWPPLRAVSPPALLQSLERREEFMVETLRRAIERQPRATVLVFANGLQVVRARARITTGGATAGETWLLAERLEQLERGRVFSVLVDAPSNASSLNEPRYMPSRLYRLTREIAVTTTPLALRLEHEFPATVSDLEVQAPPGVTVELLPSNAPLARAADLYVRH